MPKATTYSTKDSQIETAKNDLAAKDATLKAASEAQQKAHDDYTAAQRELVRVEGLPDEVVVTSLSPNTVALGSPSFDIHVIGTGFKPDSVIVFAGHNEPTTFVSATELTTGVNMDVWLGPDTVPVSVLNSDGVQSDPQSFTFTGVGSGALLAGKIPPAREPVTSHNSPGVVKK